MTVEMKPKELQSLSRIERPGEEMWKDHLFQIQPVECRAQSIENRLAGFSIGNPILQWSADVRRGYGRRDFLWLPSASDYFVDR